MTEPSYVAEIKINLNAVLGQLQNELQTICYMVTAGLSSSSQLTEQSFQPLSTGIQLSPAQNLPLDLEKGRRAYRRWIVSSGVRDAVESVSRFLETIRAVLAVWSLGRKQTPGEAVWGEDWNHTMYREASQFHRRGLPDKIAFLTKQYGLSFDADSIALLLSINQVRNCLVHRAGVVSKLDVDEDSTLKLRWLRLTTIVSDSSGEREVELPVVVQPGGKAVLRSHPDIREYKLGEIIELDAVDFNNVAWTLLTFGNLGITDPDTLI
jgi:hypothetical protein